MDRHLYLHSMYIRSVLSRLTLLLRRLHDDDIYFRRSNSKPFSVLTVPMNGVDFEEGDILTRNSMGRVLHPYWQDDWADLV